MDLITLQRIGRQDPVQVKAEKKREVKKGLEVEAWSSDAFALIIVWPESSCNSNQQDTGQGFAYWWIVQSSSHVINSSQKPVVLISIKLSVYLLLCNSCNVAADSNGI
jgi:hypothetical protein